MGRQLGKDSLSRLALLLASAGTSPQREKLLQFATGGSPDAQWFVIIIISDKRKLFLKTKKVSAHYDRSDSIPWPAVQH